MHGLTYLKALLMRRIRDQRGQTTLEYVLLGAGIVILAAAAIFKFGGAVSSGMTAATNCLNGAASGAAANCV